MAEGHSPELDNLTAEEASRIIHSHRKVRYGTACWPCRQRKVKCDNKQPCENCVKRDHAQLCSYKPNRPSSGKNAAPSSSSTAIPSTELGSPAVLLASGKKRARSPNSSDGRRTTSLEPAGDAIRVDSDANEMSRYLGQNSIPALLREQASPSRQEEGVEYIRQDMRSILGLDNSAPFPLMSSRHLDRLTLDISAELPSDREVMKLFHAYKEVPHPFWGFVLDIDELETKLMVYLEERAKNAKHSSRPTKPVSASWLAILFAVLAVGSQYHDSPYHIRTRDSQRYIQISFHFLRVGNFLLRPNLDSIQAMLMTGFVLLNDMKAEASWALLGLTTRLAQSLGLDRHQPMDGRESPDLRKKDLLRRTLWWTIVWHDCLTSLSFDRTPMTAHSVLPIPLSPTAAGGWKYLEGMYHLCQFIGNRLSPEQTANITYDKIVENCKIVEDIRDKMMPQLRSKEACRSAIDRLHHYAIRLHTSFVVSVCCRPALRRGESGQLDADQKKSLADKCKINLTETVRKFLAMHQLSVIPTRSWAFTYHGLSSAVLLGILGETKTDLEVRGLQGDLIDALSATAAKENTSPPSHIHRTDRDIELSGPLSRALTALKNIYDHGHIAGQAAAAAVAAANGAAGKTDNSNEANGSNGVGILTAGQNLIAAAVGSKNGIASSAGSGTDTPLQLTQGQSGAPAGALVAPTVPNFSRSLDPHQDAALAMAEMQHGGIDMGMFAGMQGQHPGMLPDLGIDTSTYLSPMDLYDQIFWENPEPWNMGSDSMNFDFMAQPPPGQAQQQFYF
ncbi:c6 zinc finger domain containing protein [Sporothrix brasiliensis 5110]|uniref:C6 zinc finger domain containing protein n=1 Tax=Sporothrix brasiliensis 5110 TaxID=1398154 RepID=A0A0C2IR60_9PEZI|nr:c6 zinc finger domain containing protein [Sporothrix brasiliensis 5110]KIH89375.1 c6 zinc finger domain containing protein [Sporothrix brasiliensis 5110]